MKKERKIYIGAAEIINTTIKQALESLKLAEISVELEHPAEEVHGDYATNVAMILAGKGKRNPRGLVEEILEPLQQDPELKRIVSKIEIAGPGFINFWLTEEYLLQETQSAVEQKDKYGILDFYKGKKVIVEYTDPNPFKEFHIGHLYSNIVGESLSRLYEALGAEVKRANYQGDVGVHVAKAMWGIKLKIEKLRNLEEADLREKAKFMGEAYALGVKAYEESAKAKAEIDALNKKIYELDAEIKDLYLKGRQWSLDYFETIYARLGTKFDFYYFEREAGEKGLEYVRKYLGTGIFRESEGAIIFKGEKHGLHTRVFVNSLGLPTYEVKDLGLASTKYADFPYDHSIIVTGNEIDEYFKVVLKALELIDPELRAKTKHISHGMVRLPEGKMSSRSGRIITGEWLLDETKERVKQIIHQGRKIEAKEVDKTSEVVAIGAVKYALLKANIGRDVVFDFRETLSLEGNSGPYLQYTYTRCKSVLRKSQKSKACPVPRQRLWFGVKSQKYNLKVINFNDEEIAILRTIYKFPEVVLEAGKAYSPNLICNFLFDLAQRYNSFYNKHKIIGSENEQFRLLLTAATAQVLKNGLHLLGIQTLEKM